MKKVPLEVTRRDFIKTSFAMSAPAVVLGLSAQNSITKVVLSLGKIKMNSSSQMLMKLLGLKYPIIQAPTGGVVTSKLVTAVSNEGGLGGLPLSWSSPESAAKLISTIQAKTNKMFFANFVLQFDPVALDKCLEMGVKVIQFSWGMPTKTMVSKIKHSKAILGIQVTSEASAKHAIAIGADYLVCQGTEAGGHVHASRTLEDSLSRVLSVSKDIPVVASGGISNGESMAHYMSLGAAGVVMGTRFVASIESGAHQQYKRSLVKGKSEDTVFTTCMNKGWDNGTHRILRNSTFEHWEAMGCPKSGNRPGENDEVAHYSANYKISRYSINAPNNSTKGNVEALANYAGTGIDHIDSVESVRSIIQQVWKDFLIHSSNSRVQAQL